MFNQRVFKEGQVVTDDRRARRSFLWTAASVVAAPREVYSAVASTPTKHRVTIALAARDSLYQLPLTLADRLGFFHQAGIAVEWLAHESGAKALASLLQGRAEVVAGAFEHVLGLHLKAQNYQAFVQMGRTPQICLGLSTRLAVRSAMDLKGARIGVSARDSSTHWLAQHWLLQNGLLPEMVTFTEVGSSGAAVDALRLGEIDALCNPDPLMHGLEQRNEIQIVGDARTLAASQKLMGGPVPGACLLARNDYLQRQPEVAQALSDGVVHALKWLQTAGLTDILKIMPTTQSLASGFGDRAVYLGAFEKLRESYALDGVMSPETVHNAWQAYARLQGPVASPRVSLGRTYVNVFARKSKARYQA